MAEARRSERVGELVLRELSAMLVRSLRDPRLRGATITRVRMDPDLRHGRVYFSHLGGEEPGALAGAGFRSAAGFIRREIARALNLRYAPEFEFDYDAGIENAARVDALLRESRIKE